MTEPATNTEIELKLSVSAHDLPKLRQAIAAWDGQRAGSTATLSSIYYDTADLELCRRRITLRVRRIGDGFVQTVKGEGDPSVGLARDEWEWPVAGPAPDLAVIREPEVWDQLGPLTLDQLQPVFETRIHRTVHWLADGSIELAIDSGQIQAGETVVTVSEVELELKRGQPGSLFDHALALNQVAPVRFSTVSKAARGYALALGQGDRPQRAERLGLRPEATVEETLGQICRACLNHMMANEAAALAGADAEGIHQMRVALRRLRSALSVFRPFVPEAQMAALQGEIRWLAGTLGPAREWDVFLADLLAPVQSEAERTAPALAADLTQLHQAALSRRSESYQLARAAILSQRYGALLLQFGAWLETRGWRNQPLDPEALTLFQPVTTLADRLLTKRHRRARRAGSGFAQLTTDERHQLRIALKKLRYAVEFFRSLYDEKEVRRYLGHLTALQDALGHLNDVATTTRLMTELHPGSAGGGASGPRAAGIVIGWHSRGLLALEPQLLRDWEAFLAARPFWSRPARPGRA